MKVAGGKSGVGVIHFLSPCRARAGLKSIFGEIVGFIKSLVTQMKMFPLPTPFPTHPHLIINESSLIMIYVATIHTFRRTIKANNVRHFALY